MNVIEAIKRKILKYLGVEKLSESPNSERLTYISNENDIVRQNLNEYKTWYVGSSDELLNYYTNEQTYGNAREPIYNRNRKNYFWGISSEEGNIKRVHSGIPNAIVSTLVNAIGDAKITSSDPITEERLEKIKKANDLTHLLNQQQMPLTLVEGWGAFKISFNKGLSDAPIIQYYEGQNVEYVYSFGILIGIIYKDFYKYNNRDYVLLETRRIAEGNSLIEYELFRLEKSDDVTPVPLETIPELAGLTNVVIPNLKRVLGVPSKFFFDPLNQNYGRSIYCGKIDLFDDLDQDLSQCSQTVRVSTPVEYYPVDLLERQSNGQPKMPQVYNRQYVQKEGMPNGDGATDGQIQTTQPELHFDSYSENAKSILDFILTGILSPATMGIDIAKKDNADAQREKEKVTIMTRNNVINREQRILKDLMELCLIVQEYLDTGSISLTEYDISVTFNEFANPSFENELTILGPAWSNGQISTNKYVDILWGDKLSKEDKIKEIEYLDSNKQQDNLQLGDFENEEPIRQDSNEQEEYGFNAQEPKK